MDPDPAKAKFLDSGPAKTKFPITDPICLSSISNTLCLHYRAEGPCFFEPGPKFGPGPAALYSESIRVHYS